MAISLSARLMASCTPRVHPHGADRAVHVGGIAGQDRAPDAEFIGDPLVHDVEIAADDIERLAGRQKALQPRL